MTTPLPRWSVRTVYGGGGLLFLAGAFLSGWSLTLLAEQCGIPRPFSLSLPLALDAGAAVGVTLWVSGTGEVQRTGRNTARLLFGLSVIGNATERVHAYQGWDAAPLVVAVGVAVVFPILAYRMAHLVLLVRATPQPKPSRARAPKREPKPKQQPQRDVTPPVIPVAVPNGESLEERTRRQARERQARRRARQRQEAFA